MQESASALDYMHKSGYLHNDIKSDNLLLTKDPAPKLSENESVHVVLNDFGKSTNITEGKLYNLSPAEEKYYKIHNYIAPEVIEGDTPSVC
jgi:serine/threonine protein kinase